MKSGASLESKLLQARGEGRGDEYCYESLAFRIKYAFAISYEDLQVNVSFHQAGILIFNKTYQQIAVLGMVVIILGRSPRKKPLQPCCLLMIAAA